MVQDDFGIIELAMKSIKPCVLATIIHVEGTAYLKEGTSMLFFEDGSKIGLISPGCLEEDLSHRAQEVLKNGMSRTVMYDLRITDEETWELEMGCGGTLYIFLEPVDERLKGHLQQVHEQLSKGREVLHLKKLNGDFQVESSGYIANAGKYFGDNDRELLAYQKKGTQSGTDLSDFVYTHVFTPRKRLFVFGAGEDARPLVELAAQIGFSVMVCDWRESLCNERHFPKAEQCLLGFPHDIFQRIHFRQEDYVIVMTHNLFRDQEIVAFLLDQKLTYLGILGSAERIQRLLGQRQIPSWVSAPIGLAIGARGATEIAVSILAELISVKRGHHS